MSLNNREWAVSFLSPESGSGIQRLLLPLASWILMRRVPLGRAIPGTVFGAVLGGLAGLRSPIAWGLMGPIAGAIAGFIIAVLMLRRSARSEAAPRRELEERMVR